MIMLTIKLAPVAQWIEQWPPEPEVGGSNPLGRVAGKGIGICEVSWLPCSF